MTTTESNANNKIQNLHQLFPSLDQPTLHNTLNEAKGDTAKAIVLLIQTPPSPLLNSTNSTASDEPISIILDPSQKAHQQFVKKQKFVTEQFTKNGGKCWQIISIIFWIIVTMSFLSLFVYGIIIAKRSDGSFGIIISISVSIEIIFPGLIIWGISTYKQWCQWLVILWSGLHGITIIYSLLNWAMNDQYILIYIASVFVFWCAITIFNVMFFIKLNAAYKKFTETTLEKK